MQGLLRIMNSEIFVAVVALITTTASAQQSRDGYYRITNLKTGMSLDAYEQDNFADRPGFEVVGRFKQFTTVKDLLDKTQLWYIAHNRWGSYGIMQYTSGRFLDVVSDGQGWKKHMVAVTRQANDSMYATQQRWYPQQAGGNPDHAYIVNVQTGLCLSIHYDANKDYQVYLAPKNVSDKGQIWVAKKKSDRPMALLDGVYTLMQESSQNYLEGEEHGSSQLCYCAAKQFLTAQHFIIRRVKGEIYTIQQKSTGRFLGAYMAKETDISANVTMKEVNLDTSQQWMIVYLKFNTFVFQHVTTGRVLSSKPYNSSAELLYGAMPSLATYDGNVTNQVWKLSRIGIPPRLDGIYRITNKKAKGVLQGPFTDGSLGENKLDTSLNSQLWQIGYVQGDTYEVYSNASNQLLQSRMQGTHVGLSAVREILPPQITSFLQYGTVPLKASKDYHLQWYFHWASDDDWYILQPNRSSGGMVFLDDCGNEKVCITKFSSLSTAAKWTVEKVAKRCLVKRAHCPAMFECGFVDNFCGGQLTCSSTKSFANGTCKGVNEVTGQRHKCSADNLCECSPLAKCSLGTACGTRQYDGCGGYVDCEACLPPAPAPAPVPGSGGGIAASPFPSPAGYPGYTVASPSGLLPRGTAAPPHLSTGGSPFPSPSHLSAPSPFPVPATQFAWNLITTTAPAIPTKGCRTNCSVAGWQCGFEPDGCGGMVPCGNSSGLCPKHPMKGANFACGVDHSCSCVKRTTCDKGAQCGFQADGCGGFISCGNASGNCTGGDNYACNKNKCVCTPDTCGKRCGQPVDDGCGKKLTCKCTMANEICDTKANVCQRVPGPTPDPTLFGGTPAPPGPAPAYMQPPQMPGTPGAVAFAPGAAAGTAISPGAAAGTAFAPGAAAGTAFSPAAAAGTASAPGAAAGTAVAPGVAAGTASAPGAAGAGPVGAPAPQSAAAKAKAVAKAKAKAKVKAKAAKTAAKKAAKAVKKAGGSPAAAAAAAKQAAAAVLAPSPAAAKKAAARQAAATTSLAPSPATAAPGVPSPAATNAPALVQTSITTQAVAGSNIIDVASQTGFKAGQRIVISPGTPLAESNKIAGFSSIVLQTPLVNTHPPGAIVAVTTLATTPITTTTGTPPPPSSTDLVGYYTYFYYVYFYYTYLGQMANGLASGEAAAVAQKMAPVYAYEQLKYMFHLTNNAAAAAAAAATTTVAPTVAGVVPQQPLPPQVPVAPSQAMMPPLPPPGIQLLSQAQDAVDWQRRSQRKMGRALMQELFARNGIRIDQTILGEDVLPDTALALLQKVHSGVWGQENSVHSSWSSARHRRSTLRGATLRA